MLFKIKSAASSPPGERARSSRGVVRLSSYFVASVVSLLMVSAVLPPILADQSDRAVINAPITLLTAPIAGDIDTVSVRSGQPVDKGQTIAKLSNTRVDRSTLIVLEGKADETRERMLAVSRKRASSVEYLSVLDATIKQQADQLKEIFSHEVTELKARISAASSSVLEKQAGVDRLSVMVSRNVASSDILKPVEQQRAAAGYERDAETAKLRQKAAQLEGLARGVYVGDELAGLATLSQKRRDVSFDAERLAIEQAELEASVRDQQRLLEAEKARLASLAVNTVEAPISGEVLRIGAAVGRHVSAGDTLGTMVNCGQAFVVAIFSYRQGQNLSIGSRVDISGPGLATAGTVSEILPKTSDKVDEQYAVPFPQTERRELYVLVEIDDGATGGQVSSRASACNVGRWVTVTRANGWVPSASVVWRSIGTTLSGLVSPIFAPNEASAGAPAPLPVLAR